MPQRISGTITRLVDVPGGPETIFMMPDVHMDLRELDGRHRAGSGEIMVAAPLQGRKIGEPIELELSDQADPLERTLTIVR